MLFRSAPETGYGYIKVKQDQNQDSDYLVERFVEKPNEATAKQYLAEGGYYWNGGMFVLKASTWLAALKEFRPDILLATDKAWSQKTRDASGDAEFIRPDKELFGQIPSESVDYAVIEKCPQSSKFKIKMIELDAGWNDLGAWDAVWRSEEHTSELQSH